MNLRGPWVGDRALLRKLPSVSCTILCIHSLAGCTPTGQVHFWDVDGDGDGNPLQWTCGESKPDGYVLDATDCNDYDSEAYPGSMVCGTGGADNDCDGVRDNLTIECCEPLIVCDGFFLFAAELSCESEACAWVVEYEEVSEDGCPVYRFERCTYEDGQWVSRESWMYYFKMCFLDRISVTMNSSLGGALSCAYAD